MKLIYVILHYLTTDDTARCIASIRSMCVKSSNYEIVLVNNGSGGISEAIKSGYDDVHYFDSKENLGFA